mmetsp:Transcript_15939/g.42932  ORF Transcript_15939/g.42932 Transcript_15939/m.42932 type:complete len:267 (-) Transcript_15939:49-849(-)
MAAHDRSCIPLGRRRGTPGGCRRAARGVFRPACAPWRVRRVPVPLLCPNELECRTIWQWTLTPCAGMTLNSNRSARAAGRPAGHSQCRMMGAACAQRWHLRLGSGVRLLVRRRPGARAPRWGPPLAMLRPSASQFMASLCFTFVTWQCLPMRNGCGSSQWRVRVVSAGCSAQCTVRDGSPTSNFTRTMHARCTCQNRLAAADRLVASRAARSAETGTRARREEGRSQLPGFKGCRTGARARRGWRCGRMRPGFPPHPHRDPPRSSS